MNLQQFLDKYLGKYLDYDGMFNAQCVDVMRSYVKEVYGLNPYLAIPTTGNAKDIFNRFVDNKYFKKVLNTPSNMPKRGDILFFKTSVFFPFLFGFAGHVVIVDDADLYNIKVFHQNYPTGKPCSYGKFKYKDCLGWLTKK